MAGLHTPSAPKYDQNRFWFEHESQFSGKKADIFYIYPTLDSTPKKNEDDVALYTDINKKEERLMAKKNQTYNKIVYAGDDFNFFAPFYRQMTTKVFAMSNKERDKKAKISISDVINAFQYYMKNLNGGRPFILLGHSQGSQMLLQLIKRGVTDSQFSQMIAAYLMGYEITQTELDHFPNRLIPAKCRTDIGTIISYNSVTTTDAISPLLSKTAVCINPINWTTDGTTSSKEEHKGFVRFSKSMGKYVTHPSYTSVRQYGNYLVCADVDPNICFKPEISHAFPWGNLHFADSWLYAANIKENMLERTKIKLSLSDF